jgi:predicted lysophospholipase L1 biosynthesis ABC-type transport system permease subunit
MKSNKIIYSITLGIFAVAVIGAVLNSIINYDSVVATFQTLGYPTYLIHLLGVAQIIGLALIVLNKDNLLVEWVYACFFMNFILGFIAHLSTNS